MKVKPKIGLYSAGLQAYWKQFDGLQERLMHYHQFITDRLTAYCDVYSFGVIDNPDAARKAGEYFNAQDVDLIFLHSATYFTSSCVLPVHQICKAPVIVLNLQPTAAMNYPATTTGEWLAHCVGCPVPEVSNAFERAGIDMHVVNGLLGMPNTPEGSVADENTAEANSAKRAWKQIEQWVQAAGVKRMLRNARFGFLGNNYSGMLDMYSDFTQLSAILGIHIELLEMCDLDQRLQLINDEEILAKRKQVETFFEISGDSPSDPIAKKPTKEQMDWACRIAVAQEKMVHDFNLQALSYYYHGANSNHYQNVQGGFILGHSLLTASSIPCAGEGDLKTNVAMKICDTLDVGGSFTEIVAMDYTRNTMLLGHDGPFHISIADGKPILRGMGVYHGKLGSGVSVEAQVKAGPVTLLGITQLRNGKLRFIVSEGEAIKYPILAIGNTQTHVSFGMDLDEYMDDWFANAPTHHCAMSIGHNASIFKKTANILGIEYVYIGHKTNKEWRD